MAEFWLISAPVDKSNQQLWERMNTVTTKANLSSNFKFTIPDLKVGTLDALVSLSDELGKLDTFAESVLKKIAHSVSDMMEDSEDKVQENLLANGVDLVTYLTRFQWDMAKYPTQQSLQTLSEVMSKQITQIDTDLKARSVAYSNIKASLQGLERKAMGNLLTRTLTDIVNKNDFVLDSEYLTTLLVVVPKVICCHIILIILFLFCRANYVTWQKTYESLSDLVVPRSTKKIMEDSEGGLFTVTLFKKAVDEFKAKARDKKFAVREFNFNEKELQSEKEEMTRLAADKKQQYDTEFHLASKGFCLIDKLLLVIPLSNCSGIVNESGGFIKAPWGGCWLAAEGPLLRWLKVNFSEAFIAWIHVKALRVFVESVLRYGLPVNFQTVLLQPNKKSVKRLRDVLNALYKHLDGVAAASVVDVCIYFTLKTRQWCLVLNILKI
ncbi:VATC2 ATPase, partial [Polyodon spathula]|nr:VATC2 ATPase [Polyodon spathula]